MYPQLLTHDLTHVGNRELGKLQSPVSGSTRRYNRSLLHIAISGHKYFIKSTENICSYQTEDNNVK